MTILLYGSLADAAGSRVEAKVADGCTIGVLRRFLCDAYPEASAQFSRSRAVIGATAVADDYRTGRADVVEFLPPVSGG